MIMIVPGQGKFHCFVLGMNSSTKMLKKMFSKGKDLCFRFVGMLPEVEEFETTCEPGTFKIKTNFMENSPI